MMLNAVEVAELVERWQPLASGLARKAGQALPWLQHDLESEASYALWRLAQCHGHEERFPSLIRGAVRWAVGKRIKSERLHNPTAFHFLPLMTDPDTGSPLDLVDLVAEPDEVSHQVDAADELEFLLDRADLSDRWRAILERVVGEGEPAKDVAAEEGCSKNRIHQITNGALEKIRAAAGA